MRLVLLGSPGAGKGTQAQFITARYQIPQISTGDILRSAVNAGSPLGKLVKQTMEEGHLVSDDIMIQLVKERIQQPDCKNGFLLDGYPRTIPQAESLLANNIELDCVIEIKVPDEELIKRLTGRRTHPSSGRIYHLVYHPPKVDETDDVTGEPLVQRPDDREETVRNRLTVYHQQTKPLINFYKNADSATHKMPCYIEINGMNSMEKVKEQIFNALSSWEEKDLRSAL